MNARHLPNRAPPAPLQESLAPLAETVRAMRAALTGHARIERELEPMLAVSPFVAAYVVRQPEAFLALARSGDLDRDYAALEYRSRFGAWRACTDETELAARVRAARQRELVRIAWRDLSGRAPIASTLTELSHCADACIEQALAWLETESSTSLGQPRDETGAPVRLVVFAMGKLGAHELNFSSDIDLIFAFGANGETAGGRRSIANQDYFDRLGRRLIKVLAEPTADGFAYRVDMRLRPFGDSGPLTMSFPAFTAYFEAHARDWERYAMIKARAAAGDIDAGERLLQQLTPFVFRRYLDYGAIEALGEMKRLINDEVARQGLNDDIKRGAGGIREIEFIGQTFQLMRGGREPRLRARPILNVLSALRDLGLLPEAAVEELISSYTFLRLTENRLQQLRDEQTHRLPAEPLDRLRVAFGMGYADWESFAAELAAVRSRVATHFGRLLDGGTAARPAPPSSLAEIWDGGLDHTQIRAALHAASIPDADAIAVEIERLRAATHVRRLSRNGTERLKRLLPKLLRAVADLPQPALALGRVFQLIDGVAQRSVYLALLADNAAVLGQLVRLCAASPWIANQIVRQPILLDELLDPRILYAPPRRERLQAEWAQQGAKIDPGDLERSMDLLRQYKHAQVLRVAAADIVGSLPVAEVSNHLSDIAETVIDAALTQAWTDLRGRHGEPVAVIDGEPRRVGFAVIAYGKLGGLELGYGSDLDLVFLHDGAGSGETDGAKPIDNSVFLNRLAQRLIHWLNTTTAAGRAFEVDTRLRPSGAAGLLVSSVEAYARYQRTDAWTWEHQALVRARPVAGAERVRAAFEAVRRDVLALPREESRLRRDVVEMRARMDVEHAATSEFDLKLGVGGITDIEFMVQYAVLRWACAHPELLVWTDNLRLLETIARCGLVSPLDCRTLHDAYFAYRAEVHRRALQEQPALVAADAFRAERAGVAAVWEKWLGSKR